MNFSQLPSACVSPYEKKPGGGLRRKLPELSILPPKGHPKTTSDLHAQAATRDKLSDVECSVAKHPKDSTYYAHKEMELSLPDEGSPRKISKMDDDFTTSVHATNQSASTGNLCPGVCGLARVDNNGFVNSIIQCLNSITSLRHYFTGEIVIFCGKIASSDKIFGN